MSCKPYVQGNFLECVYDKGKWLLLALGEVGGQLSNNKG